MKIVSIALGMLAVLAGAGALAQEWPSKPIRFVNPNAAGGIGEIVTRVMSPVLEPRLGQRVLVDSKPGADGIIGAMDIARAAPDGYSFLIAPTNVYVVLPHIRKEIPYDPIEGFVPISLIVDAPIIAVVSNATPVKNLKELAGYVREHPGKLNFGSPGSGSPAHILGEFFGRLNGGMVHVAYKGSPPAGLAIQANEVQLLLATVAAIQPQLKGNSVRVIGALTKARLPEFQDVPTATESGFPELGEAGNWWGLSAPKGTDPRIIDRMAAEIRNAIADPNVKKRFADLGMVTIGSTPAELGAFIRSESARWKRVVEKAGIKPE